MMSKPYLLSLYNGQIKSGDTYDKLKKCITINIVDFKCLPTNKVHSSFHIVEDETKEKLTDVLEIHYLELPKLFESNIKKDENEEIIQWMMFLETKNKEGFEMLAKKNDKIKKAYSILEVISKDDIKRAAYEAREAELHDQMTRLKSAREEGREEGRIEEKLNNAKNLILLGVDVETVAKGVGLSIEEIKKILS